jgi:DNA repair protein RecO (recombination protein O)
MDSDFYKAYLLHRRPYSDSQVMLDMLVEGVGQLRMLARVSGRQATKHKAQLQPFQALLVHYNGKYDLKYINKFELHGNPLF